MKHALFFLSLLSSLSIGGLYAQDTSYLEPVRLSNVESAGLDLESDLQDDISTLDKQILISEEVMELEEASSAAPISTKITTLQDEAPLFSTFDEPSPATLVNTASPLPTESVDIQTVADPFFDGGDFQEEVVVAQETNSIEISLMQVFSAAPFIYALLLGLSLTAITLWLYSLSKLKYQGHMPEPTKSEIVEKLKTGDFAAALELCRAKPSLLSQLMASGLSFHKHGLQAVLENMKAEGKRATVSSWQRLSLLQDIAIVAPMIGLLGTVLGMFYAFYDLNRSFESITNLFDGFGVAVGTTVAGIAVAILAMILHSIIKFQVVQSLSRVENEAAALVRVMEENR